MKDTISAKADPEVEEQVTTDGAYYSSENAKAAAEKGILLIPTSLTGTETNALCSEFELSADGRFVLSCPNGCKPTGQKYNGRSGKVDARFSHADCDSCPYRGRCPGKDQKSAVKVSISSQMVNWADMQNSLGDDEHKQLARERNAVEAIP